jgi:hypothetical protein
MKYQGWMLLFAGLLAVPQLACAAEGWGAPAPDLGRYSPASLQPSEHYRYRPYTPPVNAPHVPRYAGWQAPIAGYGYRFRPWERPSRMRPLANRFSGRGMPSYWGGMPSRDYQNAPPYPGTTQFQPSWRTAQTGWPIRGAVPMAAAQDYSVAPPGVNQSYPQYHFRPLPANRQAQVEKSVRYRPLQIQIPDRYVFRPLNPVARPAPQARPMQPIHYPAMPYPDSMAGVPVATYYSMPSRPLAYPQNRVRPSPTPVMASGPYGPSVPYPYPPVFAQNANMAPGYRPLYPQRQVAQGQRQPRHYPYPPVFAQNANRAPGVRSLHPQRQVAQSQRQPRLGRRYAQRYSYRTHSLPPPSHRVLRERMPARAFPAYRVSQSTPQQPPVPVARLNPYGTDWYDGRGDGEGAWYRLVVESAPAVSQAWEPVSSGEQTY